MRILGINCFMHDSSASMVVDGQVVAAAEEERFNRQKHTDKFPVQAIQFCLRQAGMTLEDIDHVAFFMRPKQKFYRLALCPLLRYPHKAVPFFRGELYNSMRMASLPLYFKEQLGFETAGKGRDFFIYVDHHLAHIASAFLVSGFEDAAALSIDGCGEYATCVLAHVDLKGINVIRRIYFPHSLGFLYAAVTVFLGFAPFTDEYKVMGLASYGKPRFYLEFKKILRLVNDGSFKIDMSYFTYHYNLKSGWVSDKFLSLFGKSRLENEAITEQHADIAASLQKATEEAGLNLSRFLQEKTRSKNLCISGGVGLNCVMNGRIQKELSFENIFVQPAASDAGTSLGASLYAHQFLKSSLCHYIMQNTFLGPEYDNADILRIITENKLNYEFHKNIEEITALHLSEGAIIGWFQGRMEFGPRALGARSILADPRKPDMKEIVNARIKHREPFRPFAPSVLEEYAQEYFLNCKKSPFMTFVYRVKSGKSKVIPAVTHIDETARVQTVKKEYNPKYWHLIDEFRKITGVAVLLNTSFNVKGEPIVCTVDDAIKCFYSTGLDYLVLGDYLIKK